MDYRAVCTADPYSFGWKVVDENDQVVYWPKFRLHEYSDFASIRFCLVWINNPDKRKELEEINEHNKRMEESDKKLQSFFI